MERTVRKLRRVPGRWTLISGIALISVGVLSFNAYANFSATTSYNQDISTGTMTLTPANEATVNYNLAGTDLAPGDTMQRGLTLTVGGTVAASSMTLSASDASPTALDDGTANGMTLTIDACSQAWDETVSSGIPTYACAGSPSSVLAATSLHTIITTPQTLSNVSLSGTSHLRLTWTLPAAADNTFQGIPTDTIAVTFSAPQRAATDK